MIKQLERMRESICIMIASILMLTACSDETEMKSAQEIHTCVRAVWQNGSEAARHATTGTRSLTTSDLLADGTNDISIDDGAYPGTIKVLCSDGTSFVLTKGLAQCSTHGSYWQYSPSVIYKDKDIQQGNLTFTATAVIDTETGTGDLLTGTANKDCIEGNHLLLTLHHTQALLRFAFKVVDKYDALRLIKVKDMQLNGKPCTLVDNVLGTERQLIGYTYVNPVAATYTFRSTFDIYDKHGTTPEHLVKANVTAQNTFTLGKGGSRISELNAGYYYDLNVTLNPDSLGTLSDHDNGHLTIE